MAALSFEEVVMFYAALRPVDSGYPLVRLGSSQDGGYLLPDSFQGIQACLSPGTCGNTELENQLASIYGIPCYMCDPEDSAENLSLHPLNRFDAKYFSVRDTNESFSLAGWLSKYKLHNANPIMLIMDIEGEEVNILTGLTDAELSKIRILSVEFHYLHLMHLPEGEAYISRLQQALRRVKIFFDCVHFKPNNTCPYALQESNGHMHTLYTCIEITFLNKAMRLQPPNPIYFKDLPHKLDQSNSDQLASADYGFYQYCSEKALCNIFN